MSQIRPSLAVMLLVAMLSLLAGCGVKNPQALFSPDSGVHPGGWVKSHKTVAALGTESCVECHGASLEGGVSLAIFMIVVSVLPESLISSTTNTGPLRQASFKPV